MSHSEVDAALTVLFGCPCHEVVAGTHVAADPVGDAAGGVGNVVAALECDDLDVVARPALGLRGGCHAGSVTADHHEPPGHGVHVCGVVPVNTVRPSRSRMGLLSGDASTCR